MDMLRLKEAIFLLIFFGTTASCVCPLTHAGASNVSLYYFPASSSRIYYSRIRHCSDATNITPLLAVFLYTIISLTRT